MARYRAGAFLAVATYAYTRARELDLDKRKAIYARIYDRINKNYYAMPIATWPDAWIHAKEH